MARIRSINPCAPLDEDVATMSVGARLLWAFLPCHADREGRLRDSAFTLKNQIMPADQVDVEALLGELAARRHIIRYQVDGRSYIQIRNFRKHQNPHKNETPSTIPPVPEPAQIQRIEELRELPGNYQSEPDNVSIAPADPSPDPSPIPDLPSDRTREARTPMPPTDLLRTSGGILAAFGRRWEKTERKPFVKGRFDDRTAHDLAEAIDEITDPDMRASAWAEIVPAIELYMRTDKPFYAGHSFEAFAKDLAALRVAAAPSRGSASVGQYRKLPPIKPGVLPPPRPRP